jgi:uncharacterized Zn finger protein
MQRAPDPRTTSNRDRLQPRRVRHGLKLKHKQGFEQAPWPADALVRLIDAWIPVEQRTEGFNYAVAGQVASIIIEPGRVEAAVQGRSAQPYQTLIDFQVYGPEMWDRLIEAMAAEAVYPARLFAGEVPRELEALTRAHGVELLPRSGEDLTLSCTCQEPKPCKHAATVLYHLVERILLDPRLLFTLRGLRAEHVVMRLQEARSIRTLGVSSAHSVSGGARQAGARPLESCLDDFWRPGPQLDSVTSTPTPPFAPHAILRRLGPSPLSGRFPLVGLLASIYDTVRDEALRLSGSTDDASSS